MELPDLTAPPGERRPVYRRIADHIREQVRSGELAEGARLPPIRALARQLGVNRDTVALAYEALAGEGLLTAVVGRGTFVRTREDARPRRAEFRPALSPHVERIITFERTRPPFGGASGVAPLHTLIPDPALYPVEPFRRAFNRVVAEHGPDLFRYGGPEGHPALREVVAGRFRRVGFAVEAGDVILCHGASQGIALAVRLFATAGDAVAVEDPTYMNVLVTLLGLGIRAVPVPMRDGVPDLEDLGRALARPEVKAFYTIPTFHNPLGTTTPVGHRREVLETAARHGKPVIEDAFEMDLRYDGRPVPPLAALDGSGLVVHLYSFSKSLFPGIRIGSVTARGRARKGLLALKLATDISDSMPLQAALAEFVASGGYDRHLGRLRTALRERRDVMLGALAEHLPEGATWTRPEGGYQVWVDVGFPVDTRELLSEAVRAGVLFVPGSHFLVDGGASRGLRLTLAQCGPGEIRRGVRALGEIVKKRRAAGREDRPPVNVHL